MSTIGIIGVGSVGATIAYTLTLHKDCKSLILFDINKEKVSGEALDILDTGLVQVTVTDTIAGLSSCDIIIITAGVKNRSVNNQTRLGLLSDNEEMVKSIAEPLKALPHAIFIVISNPVDVVSSLLQKYLNVPYERVVGTGTLLDTMRLKAIISEKLAVDQKSVIAWVMGEHGDSQFIPWSICTISGIPISLFLNDNQMHNIGIMVRERAYEIIRRKGATYYGIASAVTHILEAICTDSNTYMPVSTYHKKFGVYLTTLSVVNNTGAYTTEKLILNDIEKSKLQSSASVLQSIVDGIDDK